MSLLYKVVLIGESDVGKSSLFIRFRDGKFIEHMKSTIGLDNATKEIKFTKSESDEMETTAKIQLWDTAGLERAGRMTNNYYNRSHAVIFMYDICDQATLNRLAVWHEDAGMYASDNTKYFVVGNKTDVSSDEVEVEEEKAVKIAEQRFHIPKKHVFRVSAKTGKGLEEMLVQISRILMETMKPSDQKPISIIADAEDDRSSSCCGGSRR